MTETLSHGYSSESTRWELSNEYQHDRVQMAPLWANVASALKGLIIRCKNAEIWLKSWHFATHLIVLSKNILMSTNVKAHLTGPQLLDLIQGLLLWQCGLRLRHWLHAVSHQCLGSNPSLDMWGICQWLGFRRNFSPGTPVSSTSYYIVLASHKLATLGINVTKNKIPKPNLDLIHDLCSVTVNMVMLMLMIWL